MAMVTTADVGLELEGPGRLPLDEDAVRATYSGSSCTSRPRSAG